MKGLRKYLSPFAPDQSGAAAVLCEFHGLIIILDAVRLTTFLSTTLKRIWSMSNDMSEVFAGKYAGTAGHC